MKKLFLLLIAVGAFSAVVPAKADPMDCGKMFDMFSTFRSHGTNFWGCDLISSNSLGGQVQCWAPGWQGRFGYIYTQNKWNCFKYNTDETSQPFGGDPTHPLRLDPRLSPLPYQPVNPVYGGFPISH